MIIASLLNGKETLSPTSFADVVPKCKRTVTDINHCEVAIFNAAVFIAIGHTVHGI